MRPILPLGVAALLVIPAAASATPVWSGATFLQVGQFGPYPFWQSFSGPRNAVGVGVDADGNAITAWSTPPREPLPGGGATVKASVRPARLSWGDDLYLGDTNVAKGRVDLAVSPSGEAVAAWGNGVAMRAKGQAKWDTVPAELGCGAGDFPCTEANPAVAVDAQGVGVVVWRDAAGEIRSGRIKRLNGFTTDAVWPSGGGQDPDVAQDPEVQVVAAWQEPATTDPATATSIHVGTRKANTSPWIPAVVTGAGVFATSPRVAVGLRGDAGVVWQQKEGANCPSGAGCGRAVYASVRRGIDGSWSQARRVATIAQAQSAALNPDDLFGQPSPQISFDAAGRATVAWQRRSGFNSAVLVSTLGPNDTTWSPPVVAIPNEITDGSLPPSLATAGDGNAIVGMDEPGRVARREANGPWQAPEDVGFSVRAVALNDAGFAVAAGEQRSATLPPREQEQPPPGNWIQILAATRDPDLPPDLDADGDGVPNSQDLCPVQAGPAANRGCPTPPPPEGVLTASAGISWTWSAFRPLAGRSLRATVRVSGTLDRSAGAAIVTVRRPDAAVWDDAPVVARFDLGRGGFTRRFNLPATSAPGGYVLTVTDQDGKVIFGPARVNVPRPPSGAVVVRSVIVARGSSGIRVFPRGAVPTAEFVFASKAAVPRKARIQTRWFTSRFPRGTALRAKVASQRIAAGLGYAPASGPVRCVLYVNGKPVAQATARVR